MGLAGEVMLAKRGYAVIGRATHTDFATSPARDLERFAGRSRPLLKREGVGASTVYFAASSPAPKQYLRLAFYSSKTSGHPSASNTRMA